MQVMITILLEFQFGGASLTNDSSILKAEKSTFAKQTADVRHVLSVGVKERQAEHCA